MKHNIAKNKYYLNILLNIMEIYSLNINKKKFKQYKTYEDALVDMDFQILDNPNSNIELYLEDFCDYDNYDTCCKIYLLCEYKDMKIKKYL